MTSSKLVNLSEGQVSDFLMEIIPLHYGLVARIILNNASKDLAKVQKMVALAIMY